MCYGVGEPDSAARGEQLAVFLHQHRPEDVLAVAAAERFLYLAMAGPLLALGLLAATLAEARSRRPMAIGVFALVLLMFSTLTWIRNEDWRSDRAIRAPRSPPPWPSRHTLAGQNRPCQAKLSGVTANQQIQRGSPAKSRTVRSEVSR